MFTPQRKGFGSANARVGGSRGVLSKGKGVAGGDSVVAPPRGLLGENGAGAAEGGEDAEAWRRFREAGLLDEASLQRKDREALVLRVAELEKELHDYQYNMGLLLIEKKEWSSMYEAIKERLSEAEEIIKHDQASYLVATTELQQQKDNAQKALGVEKQTVEDLKKALDDMYHEIAKVKYTSEKQLSEARALEARNEEKQQEIEGKLRAADAKLGETMWKSSDVDRKLEDLEARERKLQREHLSLNSERKAQEKNFTEQKAHLQAWEKELQEGQKRLVEERRLLNDREERTNEADGVLKRKLEEIEETRRAIEDARSSLKNKEDEIIIRLQASVAKEKEADVKIKDLEKKEKDLLELEEKLNAREKEEIEKLIDEHNTSLVAKNLAFELEMEKKRKLCDEEVRSKLDAVDKERTVITRKEEEVSKREQIIESTLEKVKNKERDIDTKSKTLRNWEKTLESEKKKLEEDKKQLMNDLQKLEESKVQLESLRVAIEGIEKEIIQEKENLKITQEERESHLELQSKLKREIEEYAMMKESLAKETEALRMERDRFEREWEVLDAKRMGLDEEMKKFHNDRERFEKWQQNERERLVNEGLQERAEISRSWEDLKLREEAFEKMMEHERAEGREEVKRKLDDIEQGYQRRRHELEMGMQKKQEETEKKLHEKEEEFEKRSETELNHINSLKSSYDSKIRKFQAEQNQLEREKEELSIHKKKLEADQNEIRNDIDKLHKLNRNLKVQREEFTKERERFLAVVGQYKVCHNCGVPISRELDLLNLQPSRGTEDADDVLLPSLADGFLQEHTQSKQTVGSPQAVGLQSVGSGGHMSWLQKCSKLFKFSPGKNAEFSTEVRAEKPIRFGERLDMTASDDEAGFESANMAQFESGALENEDPERLGKAGDEAEPSLGVADDLNNVVRLQSDYGVREGEGVPFITSIDEGNELEESSLPPESDSQPQPSKQRRRQPSRRGKPKAIRRTHSVRAVVEDAKAFLGESSDVKIDEPNGDAKDVHNFQEESREASVHTDHVATDARQKRKRPQSSGVTSSEIEAEDSEARSESVSVGGRRKRRQTATPAMQLQGDKRYNLRRSTVASSTAAAHATSDSTKGPKEGSHKASMGGQDGGGISNIGEDVSRSSDVEENGRRMHVQHKATTKSVMEVHEISSQKLVRFDKEFVVESDNIVAKSVELSEWTGEEGDEVDGVAATSSPRTPSDGSHESEAGDDDEDDESEKHNPSSIGKKLWTFFTT